MKNDDEELKQFLYALIERKKSGRPLESEVVEFKEAKDNYDFKKLGKCFSALSNEAGIDEIDSAWLIFGVDNDGIICGSSYRLGEDSLFSLKQEIYEKTNDMSFRGIYPVFVEGRRVIIFEIPRALPAIPTSFEGLYYGRNHDSVVLLSEDKKNIILAQPRIPDFSRVVVSEASVDDMDLTAVEEARRLFIEKNPRLAETAKNWSVSDFLEAVPLTVQGKITRAALILLGKREARLSYLSCAEASVQWILKDRDGVELDYYVGDGPYVLEASEIARRIRNLKYRYIPRGTLFPSEVDMYDSYVIREALNNAVAHQDYAAGERVYVVECPDLLIFSNAGSFLPGSVELVLSAMIPGTRYRNPFLDTAMRNLNLIDTAWSGIKRMFRVQRERFFPMPEYDFSGNHVKVVIYGKILDAEYAAALARNGDLSLDDVLLLDRVSKKKGISVEAARHLRSLGLIEGSKPNYYVSLGVAKKTGKKVAYTLNKGLDKEYYQKLILAGLKQHGSLSRGDINELLWKKLPDVYDSDVKKIRKIENILKEMRKKGCIFSVRKGRSSEWYAVKKDTLNPQ
ncbi:MAG TPA: putative DNA binding domain-containing protein [Methanocorpusculum sp.]|nr:putative DNA binding domain-containing protein [Methanocorpusculum sp.]